MATLASGKLSEQFEDFLKSVTDRNGNPIYRDKISQLISSEGKSLVVDFGDLLRYDNDLANRVLLEPDSSLASFKIAAFETMRSENALYADRVKRELAVRLRALSDLVPLRRVDTSYIDKMIAVSGMVVRTSELRPLMTEGAWLCPSGHLTYQDQEDLPLKRPPKCELCGETRNFELDRRHSRFIDFQIVRVQELPEELPPGQLPQFFDVNIEGDIVNMARPGDRVVLTGVVRAVPDYSQGLVRTRLFRSQIDCNHVDVKGKEPEQVLVTKEDEALIKKIAGSTDAYDRLVNSIAPVILGHLPEKESILLLLAGGSATVLPDGTKLRGDINALFVGDPGTGKSELLKFASQVAPRGLYASGRGSTAAGLSAAVIREKNVLMLEAGVVVLADLGIACLHPSSRVIYDNRIVSIEELANRVDFVPIGNQFRTQEVGLIQGIVPSLDEKDYKIKLNRVTKMRRLLNSFPLVSISLRSGNKLLVTEDHLLLDGDSLCWKPAGKFAEREFLVSPMNLPSPSYGELYLWDILPGSTKVSLSPDQKSVLRRHIIEKHGTLAQATRDIDVPRVQSYFRHRLQPTLSELRLITRTLGIEEEWKRQFYIYDGCFVRAATVTPEIAYVCGFVKGDGAVSITRRRASMVVTQSPSHQRYIDRFKDYWEDIFGPLSFRRRVSQLNIGGRSSECERIDWSVGKRVFGSIYDYVTGDRFARVLTLPDGVLQGFVAGLTDADGCHGRKISWKSGKEYETWNVTYEISSDDLTNLNFLLALKRFGVVGSYRGVKKGVGIVVISSRSDVVKLRSHLEEYSVKMMRVPSGRKHIVSGISEKLPARVVQGLFKEAFDGMRTTEFGREGISSTVYEYKNMPRQPSIGQVLKVVERHTDIPQETLSKLSGLLNKDYYLDEIVGLERVPYNGYVYDLVMEDAPNFVANGVIVHNCIDEFEKMKPEDRTALHEMMEQQSYHPSTEILMSNGAKARIGDAVEKIFRERADLVIPGKDCEIIPLSGEIKLRSMSPDGTSFEAQVDRVSRHLAPENFVQIKFSNGRSLTVTPEHPVFVYSGGKIRTVSASEVKVGQFAPAPKRIEVKGQELDLVSVGSTRGSKMILQQTSLSPGLGRVLGYLVTEGNFYRGRTTEIDFGNFNQDFIADMRANADSLFGFAPIVRMTGELQTCLRYVSKTLLDWFEQNFPEMVHRARQKRIPAKIMGAPIEVAREFLATAYLGDGGVESTAVCYRTSSPGLAEDYQDLLLRFAIHSRIARDSSNDSYKVYIKGDSLPLFFETLVEDIDPRYERIKRMARTSALKERSHDSFPTEIAQDLINLKKRLGLAYDGRYRRHLEAGHGITRSQLMREIQTLWARLDEIAKALPRVRAESGSIRGCLGISQESMARLMGVSRGTVDYYERGGYDEKTRTKLQGRLKSAAFDEVDSIRGRLSQLRDLTSFRFLRIRSVRRIGNEGEWSTRWVYDLTVEPSHTFVSSGLLLHNTCTIAKGGIYATLNARTAILAACNPVLGRYNPFQNLTENIGTLPIPLLSRFDVIFVFRDQPTPAEDERLADHILAVHAKRSYSAPPPIEFNLLKKYLSYAKRFSPNLTKEAMARLRDYYLELRRGAGGEESIPPTPRTLEALIRISTARARVLLRDDVTEEDALAAIALMNRMVEDVLTDATTKKTDFGIQFGKPAGERRNLQAAMEVLKGLEGIEKKPVERKLFKEELVKAKFSDEDAEKMIRTMFREGMVYESKPGFIRRLGT